MIRKLKWKFVLINMVLVTVILAAVFSVILVTTRQSLYRDSLEALEQAVSLTAEQAPSYSSRYEPETEEGTWSTGLFGTDRVQLPYFTVQTTRTGRLYLLANQFLDISEPSILFDISDAALAGEQDTDTLQIQGYHLRYLRTGNLLGYRIAFVDLTQEDSTLSALARNLAFISLGALAVFFLISLLLARWAVRPVEKSWKQQRQFIADASHELKTPLTVMLSSLDMLEQYGDGDPVKRRRWLDNLRSCSGQMKTLVEELLVLARSDNATQQVHLAPCNFSDLAAEETLLFEAAAFEQGKTMEAALTPGIFVSGDGPLLRRILDIYLDNACKYGAPGTVIQVSLSAEGKRALLSVRSEGAPIPKGDLERIFERFYRADPSRTEEGYGLGLSIALELARLHHGKVWAASDEGGNTFWLSLPRTREEKSASV